MSRPRIHTTWFLVAVLLAFPWHAMAEVQEATPVGIAVSATVNKVIDTTVGEDGTPYAFDETSYSAQARNGWLFGKIEPAVEEAAGRQESIDVLVYLNLPQTWPNSVATVDEIKALYQPTIDDLAARVQEIQATTRPPVPLAEEDEQLWISSDPELRDAQRAELRDLKLQIDTLQDAMSRDIGSSLTQRAGPVFSSIREFIVDAGGSVSHEIPVVCALGASIPAYLLEDLALRAEVATIVLDPSTEYELDVSTATVGAPTWWNNGITGDIWDGGVVDSGVQEDHPAFASISFYTDSPTQTDTDGHGTHVAGIMASAGSSGYTAYTGVAKALECIIWGTAGATQSGTMARMEDLVSDFGQGPEVINHSLGYGIASATDYNTNDTFYDTFIQNYDILVSKSAGNEYWGEMGPSITHPAPAYNLLAVANMRDLGTTVRSDDIRSSSSSTGPTYWSRKKPDITAPGSVIRSTNAFWAGGGTGTNYSCRDSSVHYDFVDCGGTSMAAPHIAGFIVLMEDGGNNNPISQKAVLLNTADAWDSNDTESTSDDGPLLGSHWDRSYGWGYVDGAEAHFNRSDYFVDSLLPKNDTNTQDDYKLYVGTMFANEKATMVWERRGVYIPGAPASLMYDLTDLNLRLYDEATNTLVDSDTDSNDNVHQVAADSYISAVIKPYAWSSSIDGASTETFALATEENFVAVDFPTSFGGYVSRPSTVQPNEEFTFEGYMRNDSTLASHNNSLEILLPPGWVRVSGDATQNTGSIAGGGTIHTTRAVWTLRAQATPQVDVSVNFNHTHSSYLEDYGPHNYYTHIDVVQDTTAPTPDPMTWLSSPDALNTSQVTMTATTATDDHGPVRYYFNYTSSPTGGTGGNDFGWTTSTTFVDGGLQPNESYCYQVIAIDNPTTAPNTTGYSPIVCAYTFANPPAAGSLAPVGFNTIRATWGSNGNPSGTEYYAENTTNGTNSGWTTATTWDNGGLSAGVYSYRVRGRNGSGIETSWTALGSSSPVVYVPDPIFDDDFESGNTSAWTIAVP